MGRSAKVWLHESAEISVDLTSAPSASRRTVTLSGRLPSWSLLSSQILLTGTDVFSGVWTFVMVKP